ALPALGRHRQGCGWQAREELTKAIFGSGVLEARGDAYVLTGALAQLHIYGPSIVAVGRHRNHLDHR
ncbi:MAG: hypothetical protein WCA23_26000, partial [Stellaceae bacterium]